MKSINDLDKGGSTLLMVAAAKGNTNEVIRLLSEGADPLIKDSSGMTAIRRASNRGNDDIVAILQKYEPAPAPAEPPKKVKQVEVKEDETAGIGGFLKSAGINGINGKVKITVDFGQAQSMFTMNQDPLKDQHGNTITFNSMVDALNHMARLGWLFVNAYTISHIKDGQVYHYMMRKVIA